MFKKFQQQIQSQMDDLRHEVATLKEDHVDPMLPEGARDLEDDTPLTEIPPRHWSLFLPGRMLAFCVSRTLIGQRKWKSFNPRGTKTSTAV